MHETVSPSEDTNVREQLSRAQIEQRFVVNSGLILGARVVTSALSLATIPVLVSRIGVTGYGIWEALLAVATLTSFLQTAVSGTLVWRISDAYGRADTTEIRRLTRLGAGVCWALFLVLWPLAWLVREPVAQFIQVPTEARQLVSQMFPIVVALVLLGGLSETLEAVVSGCQRTGLVNVIAAVGQILNYSIVIIMINLGGGLWSLVAGQAAGLAARLLGAWVATRAVFGSVSLVPLLPRRSELSMANYMGLSAVGSVAALLRDQTDKIVLASLASPAWAGYYGIAARLSSVVMEILRPFYFPLLTAAGALNAIGDWDGIRRLYSRLMATVSIVTGGVVVIVAGLADWLIVLWIGRPIPEATLLVWLLVTGNAAAAVLTGPGTAICRGCGRVGIETTYLTVNLVLNIVMTVLLVSVIGPIGTVVATGSTWTLSSLLFLFVLHRNLDLPVRASLRAGGTALVATSLALVAYWTSRLMGQPEGRQAAFVSIMMLGVTSGLVYLGLVVSLRLMLVGDAANGMRALLRRA